MSVRIAVLALALTAIGCATTADKNVEAKAQAQVGTETPTHAAAAGRMAILKSSALTEEQKEKFTQIMDKAQLNTMTIREEQGQLKAALFKDLASGNFNHKEVATYKSKLQTLEKRKLDLMFKSLDEVRSVLGKNQLDPEVMEHLRESFATK